ncbi:hypothetical protein NDU88_006637 [Pleurodeles waltl]|uniref:Uncharacterized protein n=1 Tax=Pleurodeles waltl TaxID=8319 RepID=A0AAV7N1E8_PLEWA|nr:hypothetical protein NDU88_006637 [Pleurodeles waltl]
MFIRSLKQPVRSGVYGMRGCVRGSSPSSPAALGSLHTCAQGAAADIVGPLSSSLVRVRISLPSGPWANRCVEKATKENEYERMAIYFPRMTLGLSEHDLMLSV